MCSLFPSQSHNPYLNLFPDIREKGYNYSTVFLTLNHKLISESLLFTRERIKIELSRVQLLSPCGGKMSVGQIGGVIAYAVSFPWIREGIKGWAGL